MKILITGGTGLIGSALIQHLLHVRHSCSFIVLTRQSLPSTSRVHYVNHLHDIASDTKIDAVVNLAGEPIADKKWNQQRKLNLADSRIKFTACLVEWLAERTYAPEVLISGSAVGWYGDQKDTVVSEATDARVEYTHYLCQAWEQAALAAQKLSTRVCLLRTGLVLAPKGGFLEKMLPPFRFGLGGRLGDGSQYMPWIHLDDIVAMIHFLIEHKECEGAFNATAPQPVRNIDFTRALARALGRPAIFPVPAWLLRMIFGEMSRLLLTGQNAIPEKFLQAGFTFFHNNLDAALKSVLTIRGNKPVGSAHGCPGQHGIKGSSP